MRNNQPVPLGSLQGEPWPCCIGTSTLQQLTLTYPLPHRWRRGHTGHIKGPPTQFLIDTGRTTNLLSKDVFDQLPDHMKKLLEESQLHGLLADGMTVPFYDTIRLPVWVRDARAEGCS